MNYRPLIAILILFCGYNSPAMSAQQNSILVCLGREELRIHRAKSEGPAYTLNQHFINEFSSFNDIDIKDEFIGKICNQGQKFSPSVNLLRELLMHGKEVILVTNSIESSAFSSYRETTVENMMERIPHIFFNYLMGLQALTPTADCLPRYIPEIAFFLERYQYFESDYPASELMQEKDKVEKVFSKLGNLDNIIKKCEVDLKKRRALRGLK